MYSQRDIIKASHLAFNGRKNDAIANAIGVSKATVTRMRKHPLWKETEKELIAAEKQAVVKEQLAMRDNSNKVLAQG